MKEKVVLAYSGGLDTTAIIPWLKETFDYEVICCCIDCGQGNELVGLDERAKLSGASKLYIENVIDEFSEDFIMPCVKAGAVYENKYLLGTSMARPVIAKKLVEIARKEGAVAICHGATGKGNDQIRFELGIKALAPDIKVIAPWRMTDVWTMQSREDELAYCKAHGIDLPFDANHSYSRDRNLWHISHEGLELEDPSQAPNYDDMLVLSVTPEKAPDKETEITMTFEQGVPKTLNGKAMKVSEIITKLNELGGKHGIGIGVADDRHVGGVDERFDAAAKERKAAGLLDLIGHAEGRLAQTPVDGQRLHGQKAVGSYGHLGLGKFVCKLYLGEVDRGDDVLVNLGGNIDGGLVVCRGRRLEGAGADKGVDALVQIVERIHGGPFLCCAVGSVRPALRVLNRLMS